MLFFRKNIPDFEVDLPRIECGPEDRYIKAQLTWKTEGCTLINISLVIDQITRRILLDLYEQPPPKLPREHHPRR